MSGNQELKDGNTEERALKIGVRSDVLAAADEDVRAPLALLSWTGFAALSKRITD